MPLDSTDWVLISLRPQPGQFDAYKDALERLNASIAFKSLDRDSRDTVCAFSFDF